MKQREAERRRTVVTPTPHFVTAGDKAREQFGRNPLTGRYPQGTEWNPDDDRWVQARVVRGARDGGAVTGVLPTGGDRLRPNDQSFRNQGLVLRVSGSG